MCAGRSGNGVGVNTREIGLSGDVVQANGRSFVNEQG